METAEHQVLNWPAPLQYWQNNIELLFLTILTALWFVNHEDAVAAMKKKESNVKDNTRPKSDVEVEEMLILVKDLTDPSQEKSHELPMSTAPVTRISTNQAEELQ